MHLIDETAADLQALVEADFGPTAGGGLTSDHVHSWLHYRARIVARRQRVVLQSNEVQALRTTHPAIGAIAAALRNGQDVTPWLSERVRLRREDRLADPMFNDWQISHFHLGRVFDQQDRAKRSGPLLFAYIGADRATLLDVQPHGSWTRTDLLRILLRTDPSAMPEASGLRPPAERVTDEQQATLRRKGMSTAVEIEGGLYFPPGLGVTSARTALRIRVFEDQLAGMIREVTRQVETNTLPWRLMQRVAGQVGMPVRLGLRFEQGLFSVCDKSRRIDLMYLPRVLA
ncbi:hypothetical protein [Methylobacterium radiotolerans]|uniref:Uncharacterized protein n=1 Tax=Methylobacterium radiotolerans (strain ATCC 27329 / DSM 1819 / JCM 2831 / NBRC 15690 / NCIMB 10815 / 0-1) TaxID=426355 RepID=B1MA90_METRJ|nr:hypothetical protein [Methylobacterium radiotolerans]ACB28415.1 hypothetical protein Mrad2831_6503 [Methylobacterium radiotolerans JCM 2831]GEN01522.1 hypothetical protein MRA01_60610 [Methylobacterium radiotolerans]